jgi:coenzyme F420-0:L-glutamate ligase
MQVEPLQLPLVHPRDDVVKLIMNALSKAQPTIASRDVIVVASKILATAEGRERNLATIQPSRRALALAKKHGMEPAHVQVVLDEANVVLGGIHKTLITLKDDVLIANGGVDKSNAPPNHVILWPSNPDKWALTIRRAVKARFGVDVGVIVADSRVHPLRIGTIGCAIGVSGFDPIREYRGVIDLFGKPLLISRLAVADDLASAAHVLMGEAAERIGVVLIREAPIAESENKNIKDTVIKPEDCLFMGSIFRYPAKLRHSQIERPTSG